MPVAAAMQDILRLDSYLFNIFAIPPFIVGFLVLLLALAVVVLERASRISQLFSCMLVSAAVWLLGTAMMYLSVTPEVAYWWARFYHFGVVPIPILISLFIVGLVRRPRYFWLFASIGFVMAGYCFYILGFQTSVWILEVKRMAWGYYPRYSYSSLWFLVFFFGIIVASFRMLFAGSIKTTGRIHQRLKAFSDAFTIAILASFDFAPSYGIPLYPFGYVWVLGFVAIVGHIIWLYRLHEVTPALAAPQILDTMQGAVVVVDFKGQIRMVNHAAAVMLGYEQKEMLAMQISKVTSSVFGIKRSEEGGESKIIIEDRYMAGEYGKIQDYPMTWTRQDGAKIKVSVSASLLHDSHEEPQWIIYTAVDITRRKEAEEALQQSEERLKLLVESILDYAILMLDPQGNIMTWNAGAGRITGYETSEITGKHFSCLFSSEDCADKKPECILKTAESTGRADDEGWRVRKDGSRFWAQMTLNALKDSRGKLRGFSQVTHDMTERKQAEDILRQFATLVRSTDDAVIAMTANGTITSWNPAAQKIFGYTANEIYRHSIFDLIPESKKDEMLQILSKISQGQHVAHYETACLHKEGRGIYTSLTISPMKDEAGRIIGVSALGRDITKTKEVEEALRSSEKRFRTIIETANDAFIEVDEKGSITDWNHQAEILFGWSQQEALGRSIQELIIPEAYRLPSQRGLSPYLGDGKTSNQRFETRAMRRTGKEFPVEITVWPLKLNDRVAYNAFIHDITDRKQAEESLREREALDIKAQFVTMVSHELRTPLTAIKMGLEILTSGEAGTVTKEQAEWLDMATFNVARLAHLIDEVLEFQRLESGRMQYEYKPVDMNELIRELEKMTFKPLAADKKLEFVFKPGSDMPPVSCDRDKIAEVLINIVGNSLKYTEKGKIEVRSLFKDGQVEVAIEDTGIGIRAEDMSKLFHFFSQIKTNVNAAKAGGTGLGLAICRKIVEHHGGSFNVESVHGKGSTFSFTLPLVHAEAAEETAPAEKKKH